MERGNISVFVNDSFGGSDILNTTDDDLWVDYCTTEEITWKMTYPICSTRFYSFGVFIFVSVLLFSITIWTSIGNGLVLKALYKFRSLRSMSNCLIGNLAVSDFLLSLTVLPISILNDVLGYWVFGEAMCTLWLCIDVLYCTASIWGLVMIAVDRFTATVYPVHYHEHKSPTRALVYIAFVWTFSIIISIAPFIGWRDMISSFYQYREEIESYECVLFMTKSYVVYSAMGSFVIPTCLMIFLYVRIFKVLKERAAFLQAQKQQHRRFHEQYASEAPDMTEDETKNVELHCVTPSGINDDESTFHPSMNTIPTFQVDCPDSEEDTSESLDRSISCTRCTSSSKSTAKGNKDSKSKEENRKISWPVDVIVCENRGNNLTVPTTQYLSDPETTSLMNGSIDSCLMRVDSSDSIQKSSTLSKSTKSVNIQENNVHGKHDGKKTYRKRLQSLSWAVRLSRNQIMTLSMKRRSELREQRATKRMAMVMACFCICWLPFLFMYCIRSFCDDCYINIHFQSAIIWLGYVNSGINPILYTLFNGEFRKAFKKLVRCNKKQKPSRTRS